MEIESNNDVELKQFLHKSKYAAIQNIPKSTGQIFSVTKIDLNDTEYYSSFEPVRQMDSIELRIIEYILKNDNSFDHIDAKNVTSFTNPIASISISNDTNGFDIIISRDYKQIKISDINGPQVLEPSDEVKDYLKYIINHE